MSDVKDLRKLKRSTSVHLISLVGRPTQALWTRISPSHQELCPSLRLKGRIGEGRTVRSQVGS